MSGHICRHQFQVLNFFNDAQKHFQPHKTSKYSDAVFLQFIAQSSWLKIERDWELINLLFGPHILIKECCTNKFISQERHN